MWLGTTVENQEEADRRIPHLLDMPARVRFLSCEPLLGDISFHSPSIISAFLRRTGNFQPPPQIHWVIAGGESGPHARDLDKVAERGRSLRDQCKAAGVAYFFKQMGGKRKPFAPIPDDLMIREFPCLQSSPRSPSGSAPSSGTILHRS